MFPFFVLLDYIIKPSDHIKEPIQIIGKIGISSFGRFMLLCYFVKAIINAFTPGMIMMEDYCYAI